MFELLTHSALSISHSCERKIRAYLGRTPSFIPGLWWQQLAVKAFLFILSSFHKWRPLSFSAPPLAQTCSHKEANVPYRTPHRSKSENTIPVKFCHFSQLTNPPKLRLLRHTTTPEQQQRLRDVRRTTSGSISTL